MKIEDTMDWWEIWRGELLRYKRAHASGGIQNRDLDERNSGDTTVMPGWEQVYETRKIYWMRKDVTTFPVVRLDKLASYIHT